MHRVTAPWDPDCGQGGETDAAQAESGRRRVLLGLQAGPDPGSATVHTVLSPPAEWPPLGPAHVQGSQNRPKDTVARQGSQQGAQGPTRPSPNTPEGAPCSWRCYQEIQNMAPFSSASSPAATPLLPKAALSGSFRKPLNTALGLQRAGQWAKCHRTSRQGSLQPAQGAGGTHQRQGVLLGSPLQPLSVSLPAPLASAEVPRQLSGNEQPVETSRTVSALGTGFPLRCRQAGLSQDSGA